MDLVIALAVAVILFGAGFGFRGLISRELKAVVADFKAEVTKLRADLTAAEADAKTELKKL
jgi:hypothetical protein